MPASFFPVARKEYLTRRHAAFGALYDQNSIALDLTHLNPAPVPWGFWSCRSAPQPAAMSQRRCWTALRGGV